MKYLAIGEMCELLNGFAFKSNEYVSEGIRVIRIANVQKGYIEDSSPCFYPEDQKYAFEKFMLRKNDLLVSLTGNVGRVGLLPEGMMPAALNQRVACLRIKDKYEIDKKYLFHLLNSNYFENACIESSNGAAQKNLSTNWLKKFCVPVPTSDEQKDIARIFDSIIELIYLNKNHLEKLDELVKSRFIEMFGDQKTNSLGLPTSKLGNVAFVGSSKRVFKEELIESGVPFYRGTEVGALAFGESIAPELFITRSHYQELVDHTGKPIIGDLLMPSICPDGQIWLVDTEEPFYFKDGRVLWVKPDRSIFNSTFLQYAMRDRFISDFESFASGTTFAELKIFILKNLVVTVPRMEMQNEFAAFVQQVDKLKFDFDFLVSFSIPSICLFCLKLDP